MKDQYFGDINDYRKYGLLRSIIRVSKFRLLISWMLTPDDSTGDGKIISYLEPKNQDKWLRYDEDLFRKLKDFLKNNKKREVKLMENSGLLTNATYYANRVPDCAFKRKVWVDELISQTQSSDLVFLDPDTGIEVKSTPYGCKNSSKYLYWHEVDALWSSGKSLLIYQHFPREKKADFIRRMLQALSEHTPDSLVEAFATPYVVFLMALQPKHDKFHKNILNEVQNNWKDKSGIIRIQ